MDTQKARQLLQKYKSGECTLQEKAQIEQWYLRIASEQNKLSADQDFESVKEEMWQQIDERIQPVRRLSRYKWRSIAAVFMLLCSAGSIFYLFSLKKQSEAPAYVTVNSVQGLIKKIILPDSSIVWLKGHSSLSYPEKFEMSKRSVKLSGEALFEITKDANHPFYVSSGNYCTRVLGTSFNIRQNTEHGSFEVFVLTGKVKIIAQQANKRPKIMEVILSPLQRFSAVPDKVPVIRKEAHLKKHYTEGRQYPMQFDNTAFTKVVSCLEQKFNVSLVTEINRFKNCRITADLTDRSLNQSLQLLTSSLNATYKIESNSIFIYGDGCN